ncbi:hypothetical protein HDV06_002038 [Boothiomyces sp. JEL0866]|nr:hypothetical protein HDV06_002038 [Boothiomyces sp. JEL0866]
MSESQLGEKVRRHLESSSNISILHEFCQKTQKALPEWKPTSEAKGGTYSHGVQLILMGQRFECSGASNKQEAKKIVAGAAIEYFEKQGVPYFVNRPKNYISLLFILCAQAGIDPPLYAFREGDKMYGCTVSVNNKAFSSPHSYPKKTTAKEICSQMAFDDICNDPLISERLLLNTPSAVTGMKEKSVKVDQLSTPNRDSAQRPQFDTRNSFFSNQDSPPSNSLKPLEVVTAVHVKPQEEEILSFVDILWAYYETNPSVGMPYYNHRPVKSPDGETKYRAQLIMGSKNKVSLPHAVQADASNQVAREMYQELIKTIPDPNATPAVMKALLDPSPKHSQPTISHQPSSFTPTSNHSYYEPNNDPRLPTKRPSTDVKTPPPKKFASSIRNEMYYSDEDEIIKSYQVLLKEELDRRGLPPAEFKYNAGSQGIRCTGIFYTKDRQTRVMTTLREHKYESTAREDISHDLYVVLLSLPI